VIREPAGFASATPGCDQRGNSQTTQTGVSPSDNADGPASDESVDPTPLPTRRTNTADQHAAIRRPTYADEYNKPTNNHHAAQHPPRPLRRRRPTPIRAPRGSSVCRRRASPVAPARRTIPPPRKDKGRETPPVGLPVASRKRPSEGHPPVSGFATNPTLLTCYTATARAHTGASKFGNTTLRRADAVSLPRASRPDKSPPNGLIRPPAHLPGAVYTDNITNASLPAGDWQLQRQPTEADRRLRCVEAVLAGVKSRPSHNQFNLGVGADPYPFAPAGRDLYLRGELQL